MTVSEQIIGGHSGSNSPFIMNLYLISRQQVDLVLDPIRHVLPDSSYPMLPYGGLRLSTGATLCRMKFPPQTCIMEVTPQRSDAGVAYIFSFTFPMPGSRPDVDTWLFKNREQQFVALAETPSGTVWLVGNEERGLRPSVVQTVGAINEYMITVSGVLNMPSVILSPPGVGANLEVLFPDTDFNTDFSLDYNS